MRATPARMWDSESRRADVDGFERPHIGPASKSSGRYKQAAEKGYPQAQNGLALCYLCVHTRACTHAHARTRVHAHACTLTFARTHVRTGMRSECRLMRRRQSSGYGTLKVG
jgi:hypothetical protein